MNPHIPARPAKALRVTDSRSGASLRPQSSRAAHTLPELTVAIGIGVMVAATVVAITVFMARDFAAMGNYADLSRTGRRAVDTMTRDIRQAKSLVSFATNQLVFNDLTNGTFSYTWDPQAGTLTRVYNGQSNVMLTGCDTLTFHLSQRTPSNNFTFWPATNATSAKLIDVSWDCSRTILGQKINTESIQTAKVAIRN